MGSRRSSVQVISEILQHDQATKTEIMYKSNLSHSQMEKYLNFLEDRCFLIRSENNGRKYAVTDKGKQLVKDIEKLWEIFEL
ncbi:MAG: winged helix-turn-helix domain-containing protein [Dehalococcoidia bacterium]